MAKATDAKSTESTSAAPRRINAKAAWKQPRLVALLFCNWINQTGQGRANLIGTFDEIGVKPNTDMKPTLLPRLWVYVRTAETPDPYVLTIYDPAGKPVLSGHASGEAAEGSERSIDRPSYFDLIVQLQFAVSQEGPHWFQISYQGKKLGGTALYVRFLPDEETEEPRNGN